MPAAPKQRPKRTIPEGGVRALKQKCHAARTAEEVSPQGERHTGNYGQAGTAAEEGPLCAVCRRI